MSLMDFYTSDGNHHVELKTPPHGYSFLLKMAWETKAAFDGSPISWDNGIAYDTRILNIDKWHNNASKQAELKTFFDRVRTDWFIISLYYEPTGFFPFGADLGDMKNFSCYKIGHDPSGVLRSPWLHFNNGMSLVMRTKPTYTQLARTNQGNFYFTTIGLHQPQSEIQVEKVSKLSAGDLPGGSAYFVDNGIKAEYYISTVKLQANTANTAAVIDTLQNNIRNQQFSIACPNNVYLFGRDNVGVGTTTTYTCRLLSNEIEFISERFNKFTFDLKLLMESYV